MKVVDSPRVRVERRRREHGELEVVVATTAVLLAFAHGGPAVLAGSLILGFGLRALARRRWGRETAPRPARVAVGDGRVVVGERAFTLSVPREGWATELPGGAVVALRTEPGGLISFAVRDAAEAASVLDHAGLGLPRRFTLDRARPPVVTRGASLVVTIAAVALFATLPIAAYALVAASLVVRAVVIRRPPTVIVEPGTAVLRALALDRRVDLARVVSVQETPGGVSLLAADGTETVLPVATRTPIRRDGAKPWTSEGELRDSALAQRAALAGAVRTALGERTSSAA